MNSNNHPKWLRGKSTRERSIQKEKKLAKKVKGRTTINSGATFGQNDVQSEAYDIEHKYTDKKSFTVTVDMLEKLRGRSSSDKTPLLVIEFGTGQEYAVIKLGDLLDM